MKGGRLEVFVTTRKINTVLFNYTYGNQSEVRNKKTTLEEGSISGRNF